MKEDLKNRIAELDKMITQTQGKINQMMADLNVFIGMKAESQRILSTLKEPECDEDSAEYISPDRI